MRYNINCLILENNTNTEVLATNSITQNYVEEKQSNNAISFFLRFKLSQALLRANAYKQKGLPVIQVFLYLFQLVFTNRSMYMNLLKNKDSAGFMKDTAYRLPNSIYINRQSFIMTFSSIE